MKTDGSSQKRAGRAAKAAKKPGEKKGTGPAGHAGSAGPLLGEERMVDLLAGSPKEKQVERGVALIPGQQDMLKEMGHVGAGRASGELSRLVGSIVRIAQPKVEFFSLVKPPERFIETDADELAAVFSRVSGETRGEIMALLDRRSALALVDMLANRAMGTTADLSDDDDKRRVTELCADLCDRYLSAVGALLALHLEKEEYKLVVTKSKAFATYLIMSILGGEENSIFLKVCTEFSTTHVDASGKETPISGSFVFLLQLDAVIGMLQVVKKRLETMSL